MKVVYDFVGRLARYSLLRPKKLWILCRIRLKVKVYSKSVIFGLGVVRHRHEPLTFKPLLFFLLLGWLCSLLICHLLEWSNLAFPLYNLTRLIRLCFTPRLFLLPTCNSFEMKPQMVLVVIASCVVAGMAFLPGKLACSTKDFWLRINTHILSFITHYGFASELGW